MHKYFLTTLLFILVLSQACKTVVDIDQKEFKKRLVMTSTLDPGSNINVFVTKSIGALATGLPDSITNAVVDLYEDGNLLFNIPYGFFGNYSSTYYPLVGHTYRITVSVPGFDNSIEATATIPASPSIDTFNYAFVPTNDNTHLNNFGLGGSITINDPPGENYYMIQAHQTYMDTFSFPAIFNSEDLYLTIDNPLIGDNKDYSSSLLFTDFSFNGTIHEINFSSDYINSDYGSDRHLFYLVYSLSRDTYFYLLSLRNYQNNKDNPFAEPVQVYSNVSSQMGILGAVSKQEVQVY